tara:strand:+ start:39464 stop:40060 length:597 start_codon:yes stop_codon:yes gene_type:complete
MSKFDPNNYQFHDHGTVEYPIPEGYERHPGISGGTMARRIGTTGDDPRDLIPIKKDITITQKRNSPEEEAEEHRKFIDRGYGMSTSKARENPYTTIPTLSYSAPKLGLSIKKPKEDTFNLMKDVPDTPKKTSSKADKKLDRYAKFKKKQPRAQAVAKAVGGMGKKDSTNGQRYKPASDDVDVAFDRIIDTLTMRRSAK